MMFGCQFMASTVYFGPFFTLLPPQGPKNQNLKKLEILSFYTSITGLVIICLFEELWIRQTGYFGQIFTPLKINLEIL